MSRINGNDTGESMLMKMAEGNPGAITVMLAMLEHGQQIDPDSLDPIMAVVFLDTLGIYGADIWILHKNCCESDLAQTIAALRACQLGMTSEAEIKNAIREEVLLDFTAEVQKRLPEFGKQWKPEAERTTV